jgi:hypothetical protein
MGGGFMLLESASPRRIDVRIEGSKYSEDFVCEDFRRTRH